MPDRGALMATLAVGFFLEVNLCCWICVIKVHRVRINVFDEKEDHGLSGNDTSVADAGSNHVGVGLGDNHGNKSVGIPLKFFLARGRGRPVFDYHLVYVIH